MATANDTASNVIAFPAAAIVRQRPSLESADTLAERRQLIGPLTVAEQMDVEARLADDLMMAIMSRNARSLRPEMHPRALCPAFGQRGELTDDRYLGSAEDQHLAALKRVQARLAWLIGRLERKRGAGGRA